MTRNNSKPPKSQIRKPAPNDILLYCDFGCTTGFGNVAKQLVDRWAVMADSKTTFYIFAINDHKEEPYDYLPNVKVIPAMVAAKALFSPANVDSETETHIVGDLPGLRDVFCREAFIHLIMQNDFNVIYFFNDLEIVGSISKDLIEINRDRKKLKRLQFKSVFYFPIDSAPVAENLGCLAAFDEIITFTEYAADLIRKMAPESISKRIQVIPHGVDTETYYPLPNIYIQELKDSLFGPDKYVIGSVNRNSPRKDFPTTLMAFAEFKSAFKGVDYLKDKHVLYLHCNPEDPAGINLLLLCRRLGLKVGQDVFFPADFSENIGFSEEHVNQLYNCMDVFLTNTTAEGWGLTVTEAMAAGTPVICPLHTSLFEITNSGNSVYPLTEIDPVVFINDGNKVRFKSNVRATSKQLHVAWSSSIHYNPSESALRHVSKYSWDETAYKFFQIIKKYLK